MFDDISLLEMIYKNMCQDAIWQSNVSMVKISTLFHCVLLPVYNTWVL